MFWDGGERASKGARSQTSRWVGIERPYDNGFLNLSSYAGAECPRSSAPSSSCGILDHTVEEVLAKSGSRRGGDMLYLRFYPHTAI